MTSALCECGHVWQAHMHNKDECCAANCHCPSFRAVGVPEQPGEAGRKAVTLEARGVEFSPVSAATELPVAEVEESRSAVAVLALDLLAELKPWQMQPASIREACFKLTVALAVAPSPASAEAPEAQPGNGSEPVPVVDTSRPNGPLTDAEVLELAREMDAGREDAGEAALEVPEGGLTVRGRGEGNGPPVSHAVVSEVGQAGSGATASQSVDDGCRCWNEGEWGRVHREDCPIHKAASAQAPPGPPVSPSSVVSEVATIVIEAIREALLDTRPQDEDEKALVDDALAALEELEAERDAPVSLRSPSNTRGYWEANAKGWQARAEAAEARVKELEAERDEARERLELSQQYTTAEYIEWADEAAAHRATGARVKELEAALDYAKADATEAMGDKLDAEARLGEAERLLGQVVAANLATGEANRNSPPEQEAYRAIQAFLVGVEGLAGRAEDGES